MEDLRRERDRWLEPPDPGHHLFCPFPAQVCRCEKLDEMDLARTMRTLEKRP